MGIEKLYIHGFPRTIRTEGLSEEALAALAGNTVTVPLVGMIWMAVFGYVDFSRPHGQLPTPGVHNVGKVGEALQVHGPPRTVGNPTDEAGNPWLNSFVPPKPKAGPKAKARPFHDEP